MPEIFKFIAISEVEKSLELWMQQNGTTIHTALTIMVHLRKIFGYRIIIFFPDFFFLGILKGKMYSNRPRTIKEVKEISEKK